MKLLPIIKRPPEKGSRKKRKAICYVMVKKAGVITIATTLPKAPTKGGV